MTRHTDQQLNNLVQLVKTGGQPMSHVKETTLLEYIIAYLQEECKRTDLDFDFRNNYEEVKNMVDAAMDAYVAGAR